MSETQTTHPNPQFILVEGIPGSGKTTAARFVCEWLAQQGHQPALFLEGDWNHPADYESVACLDESEYAALREQFPACVDFLARQARYENGEWFFSYRKMQHESGELIPGALFDALARYEIYDLPVEKHLRLMRQGWQNFANRAQTESLTYVFECCFLQNPFTTLLARYNLSTTAVCRHILGLSAIIQPLRPRLIYLAQSDPRAALEKVRNERPQDWADYVTWYITSREYGQAHGFSGFEGVTAFYAVRQALELALLKNLPIPSVILPEQDNWETRYTQMTRFLTLMSVL